MCEFPGSRVGRDFFVCACYGLNGGVWVDNIHFSKKALHLASHRQMKP